MIDTLLPDDIATHVKNIDKDRFFLSLFAPKTAHHDLIVLYAFHHELVKISSAVNEPMAGKIRFQWWWDVVHGKADNASSHPLGPELLKLTKKLDIEFFENLIEGREVDLEKRPFETVQDMYDYFDKTSVTLLKMATVIHREYVDEDHLKQWGRGFGMAILLRHITHDAQRGRLMLPKDIFPYELDAVKPGNPELKLAVQKLCDGVDMPSIKWRDSKTSLSLYGYLARLYLKEIKRRNFDVFDERLFKKRPFLAEFKTAFKALIRRRS